MNNNRFILQPSQEQGFWVATDTANGIVVKFQEHNFNGNDRHYSYPFTQEQEKAMYVIGNNK